MRKEIFSKKILVYLAFGAIFFLFFREKFIFFLLCFTAGILKYIRMVSNLPAAFEPVFFFSIIITKTYGFSYTVFFILFPNFLPEVFSGRLSHFSFTWILQMLLYNILALFLNFNIITLGTILLIFDVFFSGAIHILGKDKPGFAVVYLSFLIINFIYFTLFGNFFLQII
ncbi:hypothetical protein GF327_02415 [Candidatus Woesearchaeota archaeon]|nr:hypothetical protein [Candidatus Woesearchaeota archaeon]